MNKDMLENMYNMRSMQQNMKHNFWIRDRSYVLGTYPYVPIYSRYLLHPANPRGGEQAVMLKPRGRRPPPSRQGGGAWSMVSDGFGDTTVEQSLVSFG